MRTRSISAALVLALTLTGCGSRTPSTATATADPSPSRSPEPVPEHDDTAVADAVRRAAGGLGPVKEVTAPGYVPDSTTVVQLALCDPPRPLNGGYGTPVEVRSFFRVDARTRPVGYRSGGQRAEAIGELTVAPVRPDATGGPQRVERYFDTLRAQKCTGGAVHRVDVPSPGTIGYRSASDTARLGGGTAAVATMSVDADELDADGRYPLLGHARVITRHRGYLVEASVLCARPGRPEDGRKITAEARTRALAMAQRTIRELDKLPARPAPSATG
ncbi:hypothetical protein [Micromonospora coxensis]|uniref:PknH-like extracellular domain-containing protein n=1 Tax=Micromonospora coxensis TaxID=356852 RepID=A0A1C5HYC0_9ACTN|nr:hypothetical protein [Micromonospora coxensis]SCG50883.1 hypothetical protein GA0070614_1941 [Micromonospora coxensis]